MRVKTTPRTPKTPLRRKKRKSRLTASPFWPLVHQGRRVFHALLKTLRSAPPIVRVVVIPSLFFLFWLGINWAYHTFHKPTEVLFPLDRSLNKTPIQTWREYEPLFREHATSTITPEFLAALAQVEGGGNPVARTYWRWEWGWNPLEWYQPASSAVGMYQITDGTFREAAQYCIHDHVVVEDGPWHEWGTCWFNRFYTRVLPSHAIELTAALLDRRVTQALESKQRHNASLEQKQNLAAVIHLCGFGVGQAYTAHRFRLPPHQQCGTHNVRDYLGQVNSLKYEFSKPAAGDKTLRRSH